jgi:MFS family permease
VSLFPPTLREQPELRTLWLGQSVSAFGSQITLVALPLVAVATLGASPAELGVLGAAQLAPYLLFGLFVGVWVDRARRRPLLIVADLGRAVLLASVPAAVLLGAGSVPLLCGVAFLANSLAVLASTAYQAYLPSLVPRDRLPATNGTFEASRSVARVAGPGLGGSLVQLLTAPGALLFDALSFLFSGLCLSLIRFKEPAPVPKAQRASVRSEIAEGLRLVLTHSLLRPLAVGVAIGSFFDSLLMGIFVLYLSRELQLGPAEIGLIFALSGAGALLGSMLVGRLVAWRGLGPTIVGAALVLGAGYLTLPLAVTLPYGALPLVLLGSGVVGLGATIFNVSLMSLRQAVTPDGLLGRVNGTMQFVMWGAMPLGSLLGGLLGETIGVSGTVLVAALGQQVAVSWIVLSPVRTASAPPGPLLPKTVPAR